MKFTDMDHALWTIILILCATSTSVTIELPHGVKVKCPSRYRVQAMSDKAVELRVVDNKTECDRLMKTKTPERTTNKDVNTSVSTIYTDEGYRANITWQFNQTRKRLPRIFLINLTFYDIGGPPYQYVSDTCVLLRLTGNRIVKSKGLVQFYFDCLPLLETSDVGLVVQLWSYSSPGRKPCRSKRDVPQKKGPCGPNVQCSREYSFPISKNAHSFEYCACYIKNKGLPRLDWDYDHTKERFFINFTNVPPYLRTATIELVENKTEDKLVQDIIVGPNDIQNGEIHEQSKKFGVGSYTVYVCVVLKLYLECEPPGQGESIYKDEISVRCEAENNYFAYRSKALTVKRLEPDKSASNDGDSWGEKRLQMILGVLGGLLVIVVATGTTFYICHKKLTNQNRSRYTPPGSCETEIFETDMTVSDTRYLPTSIRGNLSPRQISLTEQTNEATHFIHGYRPTSNDGKSRKDKMKLANNARTVEKKYQIMILDLEDLNNPQHIKNVADFEQILINDFGIIIERPASNLYDCEEFAFVRTINVVLIISEKLVTVCHRFRNSKGKISEGICTEIISDNLPCTVLDKMERLKQATMHHGIKPFLHIVCLDNKMSTNQARDLFLGDHLFLNTENMRVHTLFESDLISRELSPRLKTLVKSFIPSIRESNSLPVDLQKKIMQLNKDSESVTSEDFE